MGTTTNGTVVGNMRNNLNTHTVNDPDVAPNLPTGWIWIASTPGNVTNFVNQHREDLVENLADGVPTPGASTRRRTCI